MNASRAVSSQAPVAITSVGERRRWARDLAIIGGVTGLASPAAASAAIGLPTAYFLAASAAGALSGLALGLLMPRLLASRRVRSLRLPWLLLAGLAIGGHWGALVGTVAGVVVSPLIGPSAAAGALAGALQFGWMWLPYAVRNARGRRVWPVVGLALALSPAVGIVTRWLVETSMFVAML